MNITSFKIFSPQQFDFFRHPKYLWGIVLLGAFIGGGLLTFFILSGIAFDNLQSVLWLLITDGIIFLALCLLIAKQVLKLWRDRKTNMAGSRLHIRLSLLFGAVAVTPTIVMAVFSGIFFHFGIQNWFSEKVKGGLAEAVTVAQSYLKEHETVAERDAYLMAKDLQPYLPLLQQDRPQFEQILTALANVRSLTEAMIFDGDHKVLAKSHLTFALEFEPIPQVSINQANEGKVGITSSAYHDRVRALIKISPEKSLYLFVGRAVDPAVLSHLKKSEQVIQDYMVLEGKRISYEWMLTSLFFIIGTLLLLLSIWVGLIVAGQIVRPIGALIRAAKKIGEGNLKVRVPEYTHTDELGLLSRSFNQMSGQLQVNQTQLLQANTQLEDRRRFMEATLARVSAGVIRLNTHKIITFLNMRATEILKTEDLGNKKHNFIHLIPETLPLFEQVAHTLTHSASGQIQHTVQNNTLFLNVQIVAELHQDKIQGYVVTIDDITDLAQAQKQAAWSDVARRIAHEIKNPLTPIQLSAERLQRKYLAEIKHQPELFKECIETIIRQVGQIGNMVAEFSSFARMPLPLMQIQDVRPIFKQAINLQQQAYPHISFDLKLPKTAVMVHMDGGQIAQAFMNLVKNAIESLEANLKLHSGLVPLIQGQISVKKGNAIIEITDNGIGFPANTDTLFEPYVTTRAEGTGLGLAIVKKIIADHQGSIELLKASKDGGARVRIILPLILPLGAEKNT